MEFFIARSLDILEGGRHQSRSKFIYSEKATNFFEIFTVNLSYAVMVKPMVEISHYFVVFSEYINFKGAVHRITFFKFSNLIHVASHGFRCFIL